jgi:hypothetical protein
VLDRVKQVREAARRLSCRDGYHVYILSD